MGQSSTAVVVPKAIAALACGLARWVPDGEDGNFLRWEKGNRGSSIFYLASGCHSTIAARLCSLRNPS